MGYKNRCETKLVTMMDIRKNEEIKRRVEAREKMRDKSLLEGFGGIAAGLVRGD